MAQFSAGDVVQMKSGGPKMTVEEIEVSGDVVCTWFDDKKVRKTDVFKEAILVKYQSVTAIGLGRG